MKLVRNCLAVAVCLGLASVPAAAHPHVVIEGWSDVVFNDAGLIEAIYVEWAFDDNYSEIAIDGLDANGDGHYSAAELDVLTRENIAALKEYSLFHLCQGRWQAGGLWRHHRGNANPHRQDP